MAVLGAVFQPTSAPEEVLAAVAAAERAGVAELWFWEDCFKESGLAPLVAALAGTTALRVGVGILPMPLHPVAHAAMDLATIERMFPGRARFGFGHGVQSWMGQAGVRVPSPLTLMREYLPALRALLAGDEVSVDGRFVRLDRVRLAWPPSGAVPLLASGEGPKTVALTGALADGTVMTSGSGPAAVRDVAARVAAARAEAGRSGAHEIVVFLMAAFGAGAAERLEAEFDRWGFEGERRAGAAGSHEAVAATVRRLVEAGATTVVLQAPSTEGDVQGFLQDVGRTAALL